MEITVTDRLIVRPMAQTDLDDFYEYISDPRAVAFEPYDTMEYKEAQDNLAQRIEGGDCFAIEERESGKMIGHIYFGKGECEYCYEIGYILNPKYWRQGYAYEAVSAVCREAFYEGAHRIEADCDPENTASWRLLEKLGFIREGFLTKDVFFRRDEDGNPIWKNTYIYSLLNPEN